VARRRAESACSPARARRQVACPPQSGHDRRARRVEREPIEWVTRTKLDAPPKARAYCGVGDAANLDRVDEQGVVLANPELHVDGARRRPLDGSVHGRARVAFASIEQHEPSDVT
jgi:hypothetical protein